METKRKFAVFDIDGTFIRWQLFHAIVHALGKHGYISPEVHDSVRHARSEWKTRRDSFSTYEKVAVHALIDALPHISTKAFDSAVNDVFNEYKEQTHLYTRMLATRLKSDGYMLFAISGSPADIVEKLAAYYGFDAVVAAEVVRNGDVMVGLGNTPIHDKQAALNQLIRLHGVTTEGSIAVGDSESDIPLLASVSKPIAFNPTQHLFEVARERKWKIVVERKNMYYELEPHDGTYQLA